jgi:hypothetical protein
MTEQRLYSTDDLSEIDFLEGTGIRVSPQKQPMALDLVNAMTDEPPAMPVYDDVADLKIIGILQSELVTFPERRSHALGIHDRRQDFLKDQSMRSVR